MNPPDGAERFRLAEAYLAAGDPLQALTILDALTDQLVDHRAGQLLRARSLYHSAQLERAQHELRKMTESDPADPYTRFLLGRTLERRNRPAEALVQYRLAAAMSDRTEYRERLQALEQRAGGQTVDIAPGLARPEQLIDEPRA